MRQMRQYKKSNLTYATWLRILVPMNSRYETIILEKFNKHHILDLMLLCDLLPEVDKSTIYRNLKRMTENGILKEIHVRDGVISYELASHAHPHLLCKSCDAVEELDISLENLKKLIPENVQAESMELNVAGLCSACRKEN